MGFEPASVSVLKKELKNLPRELLVQYILHLAKYKKENKELLSYLLFESLDEEAYIREVKEDIENSFSTINYTSVYYAKKGIQKAHRTLTKYIRYSGKTTTQIELLVFFCRQMKSCRINYKRSKVLQNLYQRQVDAVIKAMGALHEDLKMDYESELKELM